MADVINLNRARKAKAKAEKKATAATNRAKHGRTKAERVKDQAEAEKVRTMLDGAKLEDD